jgi:hypothetical protein
MSEWEFEQLGPLGFEQLCQVLLLKTHGATVEIWGGSGGDGGVDAFCAGPLSFPMGGSREDGPFVFQVKFVENAVQLGSRAVTRLRKSVAAECERIERRIANGEWTAPKHYVLMTNVKLPRKQRERITDVLDARLGDTVAHVIDRSGVGALLLAAGEDVRRSFPTMLSFRDLRAVVEGVVDRKVIARSQAFLDTARDLAAVFVATGAYGQARSTLARHSFVVLSGPPEMGKTSIAKMLAAAQAKDGWDVIDCAHPDDFHTVYRSDRRQLFVSDDVFGRTEYDRDRGSAWGRALPTLIPRLGEDHWFVWTSRSAPLNEAIHRLHLVDAGFPDPAKVVVDAARLSDEERAAMLFQHCRHAGLSDAASEFFVRYGADIARHPRFTPRRAAHAAQAGDRLADAREVDIEMRIDNVMSDVTSAMRNAYDNFEPDQRRLLVALLDVNGELTLPAIEDAYDRHRVDDGPGRATVRRLLDSLEEQVLQRLDGSDQYAWGHPTWRDLVIEAVMDDSATRRHFLTHCSFVGLGLAASSAGGTGTRERPFLRTDKDWKIAVTRVAEETEGADLEIDRRLLIVISALLEQAASAPPTVDLSKVARTVIDRLRESWNSRRVIIPPDVLELFYEISTAASPLPAGPDLDTTFETHGAVINGRFSVKAIQRYDDALAFVEVVGLNEPRALKRWGFPGPWRKGLDRMLRETGKRAEEAGRFRSSGRDTATARRRARELRSELLRWQPIIDRLRQYAPEMRDSARRIEGDLRMAERELRYVAARSRRALSFEDDYAQYLLRGGENDDEGDLARLRQIFIPLRPGTG